MAGAGIPLLVNFSPVSAELGVAVHFRVGAPAVHSIECEGSEGSEYQGQLQEDQEVSVDLEPRVLLPKTYQMGL